MSLAPLLALHEALQEAEQFIAGFENDPHQDTDVGALLIKLRGQADAVRVTIDTQTRPELYRELIHWRGRGDAIDFGEYLRQYPLTADFLDEHAFAGRPT